MLSLSARRPCTRAGGPLGCGLDADPRIPLLRSDAYGLRARLVYLPADELQADVGWRQRCRLELRKQRRLVFAQRRAVPQLRAAFRQRRPAAHPGVFTPLPWIV